MDSYLGDTELLPRPCPFRGGYQSGQAVGCAAELGSWAEVLDHCRKKHPDVPPYVLGNTEGVVITTGGQYSTEEASWEAVDVRIESPHFWGKGRVVA